MPRPRWKRLLRISLRMVIVATTILCVWLGFKVNQVRQQKEAVDWVERMGGKVRYDSGFGPKWLYNMMGVERFGTTGFVHLENERVTDLSPLTGLTNLVILDVYSDELSDLSPSAELEDLEWLVVVSDKVQDLSPLAELANLRTLFLRTSASDEGIAELRRALPDCKIYCYREEPLRFSSPK